MIVNKWMYVCVCVCEIERGRERERESTIHGNILGTWHGCSWVTQSYYSSPCIFHTLLLFQCLCLRIVCAPRHLFYDTSPCIQPSVFYPPHQWHLFQVVIKTDIWPLINTEFQYISPQRLKRELIHYILKREEK
jgi:hypothetical protein